MAEDQHPFWKFAEHPFTWGGLGVVTGAVIVSPASFKIAFFVGGALVALGLFRANFLRRRDWVRRALGNFTLLVILAAVWMLGWRIIPKPVENPSAEEIADAIVKKQLNRSDGPAHENQQSASAEQIAEAVLGKLPRVVQTSRVPFEVVANGGLFSPKFDQGGIWVLRTGDKTIAPINALMWVRIVNNQSVASMITQFTVEGSTVDGRWVRLAIVSGRTVEVFLVPNNDLTRATLIPMTTLDDVVEDRAMSPGETATGFLLLVYPRGSDVFDGQFRFSVGDSHGAHYVQQSALKSDTFGRSKLTLAGRFDISQYRAVLYQDLAGYWAR